MTDETIILSEKDDWLELHMWSLEFRKKYSLTIREIIRMCQFALIQKESFISPVWIEILAEEIGSKRPPSKKENSVGLSIRAFLKEAKLLLETNFSARTIIKDTSLLTIVQDRYIETSSQLHSKGISTIFCSPISEFEIKLEICRSLNCTLTNEDVLSIMDLSDKLSSFQIESSTIIDI